MPVSFLKPGLLLFCYVPSTPPETAELFSAIWQTEKKQLERWWLIFTRKIYRYSFLIKSYYIFTIISNLTCVAF